jgi:hypothetical protein
MREFQLREISRVNKLVRQGDHLSNTFKEIEKFIYNEKMSNLQETLNSKFGQNKGFNIINDYFPNHKVIMFDVFY